MWTSHEPRSYPTQSIILAKSGSKINRDVINIKLTLTPLLAIFQLIPRYYYVQRVYVCLCDVSILQPVVVYNVKI